LLIACSPDFSEFFRTRILPFFRRPLHGNLTLTALKMGYLSGFDEQLATQPATQLASFAGIVDWLVVSSENTGYTERNKQYLQSLLSPGG
jgi:hypothetical protein